MLSLLKAVEVLLEVLSSNIIIKFVFLVPLSILKLWMNGCRRFCMSFKLKIQVCC